MDENCAIYSMECNKVYAMTIGMMGYNEGYGNDIIWNINANGMIRNILSPYCIAMTFNLLTFIF